jgi:hypothetical protein
VEDLVFGCDVWVVDGNLEKAIAQARRKSGDIRFAWLKRMRYGPKPSTKRRNKHRFRHDWFNPISGYLSKSRCAPSLEKSDRRAGKGGPSSQECHWY